MWLAGHVHPVANGMATAADWMSAASFISMAGIIAFAGYDASVYLMGWTGGYVLLALLLAPYLRKFGQFTVPDFIGERYYSKLARIVAVICLIVISFTYIAGQMRGVGVVFSRFLELPIHWGVIIGMGIVFLLRRSRRNERHHLYASRAILRVDISLISCRRFLSRSSSPAIRFRNLGLGDAVDRRQWRQRVGAARCNAR